jgi:diguanylate cyclase (GGDEF)-like protein/PAS domain S-box-containing protein
MSRHSETPEDFEKMREKIIGLGERSVKKSYYPKLQEQIRELGRTQEQLKQVTRQYELLLKSAGEGILGLDNQGNVTFINKAAASMLGYKEDELIGRSSHLTWHYKKPDGTPYPMDECPINAACMDGSVHSGEEFFIRKDGTGFSVEFKSIPLEEDGVIGSVVTFRDITGRLRIEEELRTSEANYRAIFDSINDAIFVHDIHTGDVTSINRRTTEMFGYSLEEFRDFKTEALFSRVPGYTGRDALRKIRLAEETPQVFEWLGRKKDGQSFWVEVSLRRAVIAGATRVLAVVRDITDRKQAEERLRESETNLRTILDSVYDAVFIHNPDGTILDVNRKMLEIYRVDREQALRSTITDDFSAPDNLFENVSKIWNRAVEGEDQFFEWKAKRPNDGSVFDAEVFLHRIKFQNRDVILASVRDVTERKKVEEALKLTQFSMDHASIAAFVVARDGRILYVNEQASRGLGYSREELLSMSIPDLDPDFPHSRWGAHWEQLTREKFLHFESLHRRKDGTLIPMDISVNYLSFGGQEYNVAFTVDISERKRVESELRLAYDRIKSIIDSMNDAISLIDVRDFTIVRVNNVFLRTYGYSEESEVIGKKCHEITHHRTDVCSPPDDICPLIETVKNREHFSVDHVHYDRDGNKIFVEVSTSPIRDESGNVVQVVHVQRDITERKKAEDALRESENRFRAFFDSAGVGTAQVDPATRKFLRVNQEFCRMTGYSSDELMSMTFNDLTHPEDRKVDEAQFTAMLSPGAPMYQTEKRYMRKDGTVIWVHVSATVVFDSQGKPLHTAGIIQDVTDRRRMEEDIRHMAHHDPLTGLPNRRLFNEIAGIEIAQAERNNSKLAILFLDLDRFKEINDTLGHQAGDQLLMEVAYNIKNSIRKSDTVARIGGDEFNVILADIRNPENISVIARKLTESFRMPFDIADQQLHVTTSIGISVYPDDSTEIDTLLRYADIAMYHAKESGRNNYQFYNPAINIRSIKRMRLEGYLRQAIERGELAVYYQPQINIITGKMVCAEALVRWNHPREGLLEPKEFLPLAEETGLITSIDQWVLNSVCRQGRAWIDSGFPPVCITVNLSSRQFQSPTLVSNISSILDRTGMSPDSLDLEITETTAMSDIERTASQLRELIEMGIHISIDDFGTGYSSLNYLKKLPIKRLKIDQSFIHDIATDADDRAIITAVTSMARSMSIKTVAEGVETEEQLSFLRDSQCDEAQGFFFSRPLTPEKFTDLMTAGI